MTIQITASTMTTEVNGAAIAKAVRVDGGWRTTSWPDVLTYNQAITALTIAERLASGYGETDPFVVAWREELTGA